ncbi:hypothetical protein [[Phormidium ambiguum] IAM M-71]|uniref:hypothetical protein n=1 Tax=[Phormidium ambiguum] IAM M-71 TaxID=454136 RepID=UPI0011614CAF|nr:hypothetical protein [Phormidium ambiguum]
MIGRVVIQAAPLFFWRSHFRAWSNGRKATVWRCLLHLRFRFRLPSARRQKAEGRSEEGCLFSF